MAGLSLVELLLRWIISCFEGWGCGGLRDGLLWESFSIGVLRSEWVAMFEFAGRCFGLGFVEVMWNGDSDCLGRAEVVLFGVTGRTCTLDFGFGFEHSIYVCLK